MDVAAPAEETPPLRMHFSGQEKDLLHILIRGSLLQIPTVGFYRFWLTTDVRRHLWTHTQIGADHFEYVGRARELLFGFLVAIAVLVPIYLAVLIVSLEAERVQAFASLPLLAVTYILGYYAIYRARRYRATHTILRSVRFWMTGSGWAYLGRAVVWDLLTLFSLGFAYSWRAVVLERYKMRNTYYGSLQGDFVATGWTLFKRAAWIWAIYLVCIVAIVVFAVREDWLSAVALGVPLVIATPFLFPVFRAIELRWWIEGVRIGPVAAASDLRIGQVVWCYVKTVLISMVYGGVGGMMIGFLISIVLGIAMLVIGSDDVTAESIPMFWTVSGGVMAGIVYFGFLLGFDVIRRLYLDRGVWAAATESATLTNLEALEDVKATDAKITGGFGEGLLDALDFGGGI
jgi:uncharacterized membrane protein YjgN (DUF898 family)